MAKLPKKTTMYDTIVRVQGYAHKLNSQNKITWSLYEKVHNALRDLIKAIEKA